MRCIHNDIVAMSSVNVANHSGCSAKFTAWKKNASTVVAVIWIIRDIYINNTTVE